MFVLPIDADTELRLFQPEHAAPLFELIDANRAYLGRWFPWVESMQGSDDTEAFIHRSLEKFGRADGFEAGIWHRGELVGVVGLHRIDRETGATEIGYWLAEAAQGRGLMTRAVAAAIDAVLETIPRLERVVIKAWAENERSQAIPRRLGFLHEGTERHGGRDHRGPGRAFVDHEVFSLLRDEWAARRPLARTTRPAASLEESA